MKSHSIKNSVLIIFALSAGALSLPTFARDISAEQRAAYDARKQYEQANADVDSYTKQVETQEKFVVQEQARLNDLQEKKSASQQALEKAKADLEAKDKILDEVWDQRDK
jgi:hypothetical protein